MTSHKIKKLSLKRETIRTLTGGQLDAVAGGTFTFTEPPSKLSHISVTVPTLSTLSKLTTATNA